MLTPSLTPFMHLLRCVPLSFSWLPMAFLMALLLGFLLLFLHGSTLLLLGFISSFSILEYCHIDINDNLDQQFPPFSFMAIFFFSPLLTSVAKECTRTPPVELLPLSCDIFMNQLKVMLKK